MCVFLFSFVNVCGVSVCTKYVYVRVAVSVCMFTGASAFICKHVCAVSVCICINTVYGVYVYRCAVLCLSLIEI